MIIIYYSSYGCSSVLLHRIVCGCFFFFKQKTAYEMRISDWSSDVCSSDLFADELLSLEITDPTFRLALAITREAPERASDFARQIGRASCRERVCQYV